VSAPSDGPAAHRRPPSELALRVASGLAMAIVALTTAWLGGYGFALLWTLAAILVLREWLTLVGLAGTPRLICWIAGAVAIAAAGAIAEGAATTAPQAWIAVAIGAAAAAALAPADLRLWAALGVAYAAVVAIVPIELRGHAAYGLVAILWVFAVVWITDIAAYFVGRAIGGPRLWPRISPKKTWSGFIGGVAGGTLAAVALVWIANRAFGADWISGLPLLALTVVAAVASQGGDLFESALKRRFGAKDSSSLIPGHGGVMDRLDSFWAVCLLLLLPLYGGGLS